MVCGASPGHLAGIDILAGGTCVDAAIAERRPSLGAMSCSPGGDLGLSN
jgi:hypothetical protein